MAMELADEVKALPKKKKIRLFDILMTGSVGKFLTEEELEHYIGNHSEEKVRAAIAKLDNTNW